MKAYERVIDTIARQMGFQVSRVSSADGSYPIEASERDKVTIQRLLPYTMTSSDRLWSLLNAVRYVIDEDLPGDFVECGVWRGGSIMAMAGELSRLGVTDRQIWLYDTFAGMTQPSEWDVEAASGVTAARMLQSTPVSDGNNVWCVAGRADVEANLKTTGYPFNNFIFVEGDVTQTLVGKIPENVSLLRLDTDWFESTRMCLEFLYPRLVIGGVCILDDYGHWQGARKAVDEYFAELGHRPYMHSIDFSGRVFIKTR